MKKFFQELQKLSDFNSLLTIKRPADAGLFILKKQFY